MYFGHNTYGVESASKYYFGTSARNLDPADSALLAAVLKSPSTYDPISNPEAALARRIEQAEPDRVRVAREHRNAGAAIDKPRAKVRRRPTFDGRRCEFAV